MMEESVSTFETHLTAVMDSLIRASVCEITKLFQETVNDYLVELSLNRKENEALKLRLRLTEGKLRTERRYGLGWASHRRNAGLAAAAAVEEAGGRHKRKVDLARGKLKKGPSPAHGRGWPGAAWEEAGGGRGGGGARAGREGKEAREAYLITFPRDDDDDDEEEEGRGGEEEDEGGMVDNEDVQGGLSAEGEETANIKEEFCQTEGYQPASLRLIKEALKMNLPNQNFHVGTKLHNEELLDRPPSLHPRQREDSWEACHTDQGGMSIEELRGLECALKAEKGREQAARTAPPCDSKMRPEGEITAAPKYIGLDGMEQDEEMDPQPPTLEREDQGRGVEVEGMEVKTSWVKKIRENESCAVKSVEDAVEHAESEQLPQLSAPGSVGESGEEEDGGDLLHFCPHCGGGFTSEAELDEHPCPLGGTHPQSSGEEGSTFPCAHCGNTFSHSWALKNHECACAAERPHCCEICGKRFTHSRSLERHHLVHTGERPHRCPQCGRCFSRLGNLERHQRIHTGERPYGCDACGKRFSRVEYLKRHQLIHSSERAMLQCSNCGRGFCDVEQLKNHQCF